jgi:hypothetical protein
VVSPFDPTFVSEQIHLHSGAKSRPGGFDLGRLRPERHVAFSEQTRRREMHGGGDLVASRQ